MGVEDRPVQVEQQVDLRLELVSGRPISGRLVDGSVESEFVGWTELVANLKRTLDKHEITASVTEDD